MAQAPKNRYTRQFLVSRFFSAPAAYDAVYGHYFFFQVTRLHPSVYDLAFPALRIIFSLAY